MGPNQVEGPMKMRGHNGKEAIIGEILSIVAVKKIFAGFALSLFQNDGATVECSTLCTSTDPVSNSMLLELKRCGMKELGEGIEEGAR